MHVPVCVRVLYINVSPIEILVVLYIIPSQNPASPLTLNSTMDPNTVYVCLIGNTRVLAGGCRRKQDSKVVAIGIVDVLPISCTRPEG